MKQTKSKSLLESILGALIAAPSSIFIQYLLFGSLGAEIDDSIKVHMALIAWVIFLCHSIVWRMVIRRIMERGSMSKRKHEKWVLKRSTV